MFDIIFYRDKTGRSEIVDYLDELQKRAETDKNARANREKDEKRCQYFCRIHVR